MNYRKILDNPDRAINERWGDPSRCPWADQIQELAAQWQTLKPEHSRLQTEKGACSRRIGEARREAQDCESLLTEMATITMQLGALAKQQKKLEEALAELLESKSEEIPSLPHRFNLAALRPELPAALPIRILSSDDSDADAWDTYVSSHPGASLYHHYRWRQVIRQSFGHNTCYWRAVDANGKVIGVLPLVRLRSRLFGDFGVSVPYFNYGGVLADCEAARTALLGRAATFAETEGLSHLELREMAPLAKWPSREDKVSMIRRLPADVETLGKEIGAKVRAQIKQARRHEHHIDIGGAELLGVFYRIFAANMRDLGTPVYSQRFFREILDQFSDRATIVVVRAPTPVAAAFLLGHGDTLEIPWASTLRSANPMNMNMLLYWEVLSLAVRKRYQWFDFGRSSIDAGTFQFKKQWGAEPVQHHWSYWLPDGSPLPRLSPDNPKYRLAIGAWRRLPVALTKLIGPSIVKYLP